MHEPQPPHGAFRAFMAGQAAWYVGWGLQMVLFQWLVTIKLQETPERLGWSQTALMLPLMLLMLVGGAVADRSDLRTALLRYQVVAMLPPLALAGIVLADAFSYAVAIGYALAMGSLNAFVMPARDAMLSRVAGADVQKAVTQATAAQFCAQLAGMLTVGLAGAVGASPLLVFQAVMIAVCVVSTLHLPAAPPHGDHTSGRILDSLAVAARSPMIAPTLVCLGGVGVLYIGSFMVVLPLLVRDVHGGGATELSLINVAFWVGTIVSTFWLLRRGGLQRPGRGMMAAISVGAVVLAAFSLSMPFWVMALLCGIWGMGAGVSMTAARTVVQTAAPAAHRARILALYQLCFFGSAPIGSALMGYIAGAVGPQQSVLVPAIAMALLQLSLLLGSRLWQLDRRSLVRAG